jgi:hypothetical protein
VLHGSIVPQLETNLVSWVNLVDFGSSSVVESARVTSEVIAWLEKLLGWHDAIAVLTNVLPIISQLAIDNQLAETVVGLCSLQCSEAPEGQAPEVEVHNGSSSELTGSSRKLREDFDKEESNWIKNENSTALYSFSSHRQIVIHS